jgi:hypothetical protein
MTSDEAARATNQCLLHEGPLLVASGIAGFFTIDDALLGISLTALASPLQ